VFVNNVVISSPLDHVILTG